MCMASPFNHLVQPIPTPPGPSPQVRWLDPPRPPTPTIFETEVVGALANTHHEMVVFPSKPVVPALKLQAPSRSAGRRRSGQRLGLNLQLLRHFFWAVPVGSWMTSDGFPPAAPGPCSRFPPKKTPRRLPLASRHGRPRPLWTVRLQVQRKPYAAQIVPRRHVWSSSSSSSRFPGASSFVRSPRVAWRRGRGITDLGEEG